MKGSMVIMDSRDNTKSTIFYWHNFKSRIIFESIIVGALSGITIVAYRYMLELAGRFSKYIYGIQHKYIWFIPIWILILIIAGLAVGYIVKKEPMSSGSGIPQVEGVLLRKLDMNWLRVITAKFLGGVMCIGGGLSLGREGPSIQMGAAIGQGISRIFKKVKIEEKFLITSGASAGLAAAFNAPVAGVIFALEEVHKNFYPLILTSALASSITADFVSKQFFGMKPMFNFQNITPLPLDKYLYIIGLGIILGLFGALFNKELLKTQDLYSKSKHLPKIAWPVIPFVAAELAGFFLPEILGGGNNIVVSLVTTSYTMKMLIIILIAKFIFTMISYGSSAPGGIFLPLLAIGALIGAVYGNLLNILFGFDSHYIINLVILAMAGYFAAIVKAPITGGILITEMTGSFTNLLSIAVVCLTAYLTSEMMHSKPIYESLLERFLNKNISKFEGEDNTKEIVETPVCMGSSLEGKKIKEVDWPNKCLIVEIKRGDKEIVPKGDTTIYAGDYLVVLTNEDAAAEIKEHLSKIGQNLKSIS